jgi:2-keto-4-pentenoate hydratase/2-oxohepta-3-ene-1,7-dioic acid hydratase in catechol pathway
MRFVTYRHGNETAPGVIEADAVRRISTPTLREYLALAPHERIAWHSAEDPLPLREVSLEAPLHPARNVFCVGRNYLEHAREGARAAGRELRLPPVPTFFTKAPTAIAGPGATLHLQADLSDEYDYEAELAVVIGSKCKNVAAAEAMHAIFGYTALNDVTARNVQRERGQWFKGKSLDDCCPLGPWIVSRDEIEDPQTLEIVFRLNGIEKQRGRTADMIFHVPAIVAELSKGMTLLPGDVIATGTPAGVGFARTPPEFLADGDVMEVEIEQIGVLRNIVSIA